VMVSFIQEWGSLETVCERLDRAFAKPQLGQKSQSDSRRKPQPEQYEFAAFINFDTPSFIGPRVLRARLRETKRESAGGNPNRLLA